MMVTLKLLLNSIVCIHFLDSMFKPERRWPTAKESLRLPPQKKNRYEDTAAKLHPDRADSLCASQMNIPETSNESITDTSKKYLSATVSCDERLPISGNAAYGQVATKLTDSTSSRHLLANTAALAIVEVQTTFK